MLFFFTLLLTGLILLSATVLLWQKPVWIVYSLFVFIVLGELCRITIPGLDIQVLGLDLVVLGLSFLWLIQRWWNKKSIALGKLSLPVIIFSAIAALSLLLGTYPFTLGEAFQSTFYLVRFIGYFMVYLIVLNEEIQLNRFLSSLFISSIALSLIGFVQLYVAPDFTFMAVNGWDPHIGRLLSSWFDPNFLGGFFAFVVVLIINLLCNKKLSNRQRIWCIVTGLITVTALYLTYSRSAYLTLFFGLGLTGLFRSPRLLMGTVILMIVFTLGVPRARERILDLYESTFAFATDSYDYAIDDTARLRVESWQQAIEIFQQSPVIGVGYNTLRFVKYYQGMASSPDIHSASGSDSSLLTVLTTTGVAGFIVYVGILMTALQTGYRRLKQEQDPGRYNFIFGFMLAFGALLLHAMFVNSLLLPYFLVIFWCCAGLIEKEHIPRPG